jgi:hypothetical protein
MQAFPSLLELPLGRKPTIRLGLLRVESFLSGAPCSSLRPSPCSQRSRPVVFSLYRSSCCWPCLRSCLNPKWHRPLISMQVFVDRLVDQPNRRKKCEINRDKRRFHEIKPSVFRLQQRTKSFLPRVSVLRSSNRLREPLLKQQVHT